MPRIARILLPNTAHHIVQRGYNRKTVFICDDDFMFYLTNLVRFKKEYGCKIYAYCLMSNHVHLIVNPGERTENLSMLIKRVAGRQTRYVNLREGGSGTLWDGRFRSSVILTEKYLAACCRYVELNPVRAGICSDPTEFKWSSYACKVQGKRDPVVDLPTAYLALGKNQKDRRKAYSEYVYETVADDEIKLIRTSLMRGQPTNQETRGDRFKSVPQ